MAHRMEKINKMLKKHLAETITKKLNLKSGVLVTVTKVDTSVDLKYTRVFISVFPQKDFHYVLTALNCELFAINKEIRKNIALRIFPKIQFLPDSTEAEADEIEKIFKEISDE